MAINRRKSIAVLGLGVFGAALVLSFQNLSSGQTPQSIFNSLYNKGISLHAWTVNGTSESKWRSLTNDFNQKCGTATIMSGDCRNFLNGMMSAVLRSQITNSKSTEVKVCGDPFACYNSSGAQGWLGKWYMGFAGVGLDASSANTAEFSALSVCNRNGYSQFSSYTTSGLSATYTYTPYFCLPYQAITGTCKDGVISFKRDFMVGNLRDIYYGAQPTFQSRNYSGSYVVGGAMSGGGWSANRISTDPRDFNACQGTYSATIDGKTGDLIIPQISADGSFKAKFAFNRYGSPYCEPIVSVDPSYSGANWPLITSVTCNGKISCSWNGGRVDIGTSVTAFERSSVPSGGSCLSETRTCTASGTLSGSFRATSCTVRPLSIAHSGTSCSFNGLTIANGSSVKAYAQSSVAAPQTCSSERRTCTDGVLSGSKTFSSCAEASTGTCQIAGESISFGSSIKAYQSASVPNGQSCISEIRNCSAGGFSGSYQNLYCSAQAANANCSFAGKQVPSGSSVPAYQRASVARGLACVSETRTCGSGTLSGSYLNDSCTQNLDDIISQYYRDILGREPDLFGLNYYMQQYSSGAMTLYQVRSAAANSAEVSNQINNFYQSILDRPANAGDIATWATFMTAGTTTLAQVRTAIAASSEASEVGMRRAALQIISSLLLDDESSEDAMKRAAAIQIINSLLLGD